MGGKIKIEMTGELNVSKFEMDPSLFDPSQKAAVEKAVKEGFTKGLRAKDFLVNFRP